MPSPFPGMDPYLEGSTWTSVHVQLSVEIGACLRTPKRFVLALPDETEEILVSTSNLYPDVSVAVVSPDVTQIQTSGIAWHPRRFSWRR